MILVVGGQGVGKRHYVRGLGFADDDIAIAVLDDKPVIADLHVFLRNRPDVEDDMFLRLLQKQVVICNEVGCGIVPMDAAERAWRDRVGRTCALLAAKAEKVVRVCCGIPVFIKGGEA